MERPNSYTIAFRGLKNGEHDFVFPIDGALFAAYENAEIRDGAGEVRVRLDRGERQLVLDVRINARVTVPCDRCLEDCTLPVSYEGRLAVKFSEEGGEYDGEVLWLYPGDTEVDLAQYVYESIVLSLPYRRVHPDGECDPAMLERFRIVSPQEFAAIEAEAGDGADEGAGAEAAEAGDEPEELSEEERAELSEAGEACFGDAAAVNARWREQLERLKARMESDEPR